MYTIPKGSKNNSLQNKDLWGISNFTGNVAISYFGDNIGASLVKGLLMISLLYLKYGVLSLTQIQDQLSNSLFIHIDVLSLNFGLHASSPDVKNQDQIIGTNLSKENTNQY